MKTPADRFRYLPLRIIGIAVVLFSSAGIAAIIGLFPAAIHDARDIRSRENVRGTSPNSATASAQAVSQRLPVKIKERSKIRCAECGLIVWVGAFEEGDAYRGPVAPQAMPLETPIEEAGEQFSKRYSIVVRMADGSIRVIPHASPASWRLGERVIVIAGRTSPNL